MAESTLALTKAELEGNIGYFLGYGRGSANADQTWTSSQQANVNSSRRSGLRAFYTASAGLEDGSQGYPWSFLRPVITLPLRQGAQTVALPDDYHGIEGRIAVSSPATLVYKPLPVTGIGVIQEQYARLPTLTGWPTMAAIQPLKGTTGLGGQRFQLWVYPIADQAYSLQFQYWLNTDDLDADRPYPYGGAQHSQTIIAACLAAAEVEQDDMAGPQSQRFAQLLQGSIAVDRRNKPQLAGYCGDRSDGGGCSWDRRQDSYAADQITFDGTQY